MSIELPSEELIKKSIVAPPPGGEHPLLDLKLNPSGLLVADVYASIDNMNPLDPRHASHLDNLIGAYGITLPEVLAAYRIGNRYKMFFDAYKVVKTAPTVDENLNVEHEWFAS